MRQLQLKRTERDRLLTRIPVLADLRAAWLVLRSCACHPAKYVLRVLPPASTSQYAPEQDAACGHLLVHLPLNMAGSACVRSFACSLRLLLEVPRTRVHTSC